MDLVDLSGVRVLIHEILSRALFYGWICAFNASSSYVLTGETDLA